MSNLPLEGLRVVDFGWVWAAPVLGHYLGDMGAEVIKVESKARLDFYRLFPPFVDDKVDMDGTYYFHALNRSKRSVTLQLGSKQAQDLARELIQKSDIVIENYSPRVMKSYGLDYESLRKVKPDLIMASLSAAGQCGPLSNIAAYGPTLSGFAGLDSLIGYDGEGVLGMQLAFTDPTSGVIGVFAVLAALRHRRLTGEGQYIDMSQSEAAACFLGEAFMDFSMNGRVAEPRGNRDLYLAPHGCYPSLGEDDWVTIACRTEEEWQNLCRALGNPDWTEDPRFADRYLRVQNKPALDAHLGQWTAERSKYEAMEFLQAAGVPAAAALNASDLFCDPQLSSRDVYVSVDHPKLEGEMLYGVHWNLSESPGGVQCHAPLMGQDNGYVFGELLDLSAGEIERLMEEKVIY